MSLRFLSRGSVIGTYTKPPLLLGWMDMQPTRGVKELRLVAWFMMQPIHILVSVLPALPNELPPKARPTLQSARMVNESNPQRSVKTPNNQSTDWHDSWECSIKGPIKNFNSAFSLKLSAREVFFMSIGHNKVEVIITVRRFDICQLY